MIDLTPLDVRKKKNDFPKGLRGYDASAVDHFLADRAQTPTAIAERAFVAALPQRLLSHPGGSALAEVHDVTSKIIRIGFTNNRLTGAAHLASRPSGNRCRCIHWLFR